MQLGFTKNQVLSILKVTVYIAISGALSSLLTYATDNKESFGAYYPVVNILIVAAVKFVSREK